jgi:enoyl-CoA hydratase/carnithine racemase
MDAAEAKALGMVDELVPPGQAVAAALKKCAQYAVVAPLAAAGTRAVLARAPASLNDLLVMEADLQQTLRQSADHTEGRQAFKEKRAAVFTGR